MITTTLLSPVWQQKSQILKSFMNFNVKRNVWPRFERFHSERAGILKWSHYSNKRERITGADGQRRQEASKQKSDKTISQKMFAALIRNECERKLNSVFFTRWSTDEMSMYTNRVKPKQAQTPFKFGCNLVPIESRNRPESGMNAIAGPEVVAKAKEKKTKKKNSQKLVVGGLI